jgi:hypothetical protein
MFASEANRNTNLATFCFSSVDKSLSDKLCVPMMEPVHVRQCTHGSEAAEYTHRDSLGGSRSPISEPSFANVVSLERNQGCLEVLLNSHAAAKVLDASLVGFRPSISEQSMTIVDKICLWLSAIHKQYKMDGEVELKEDSAFTVGSHAFSCLLLWHCIQFIILFLACLVCVHVYSRLWLSSGGAHLQVWCDLGSLMSVCLFGCVDALLNSTCILTASRFCV